MPERMKINEQATVGPQPAEQDIAQLASDGFKSVVNFRTTGEDEQPLSPRQEGRMVEAAAMKYLHVPVSMKTMDDRSVDKFRSQLNDMPKPVYAHCKSGKRAGAMLMMDMAVKQGMSGEQTLEKAKEMGFECDQPQLEEFVKNYVDGHLEKTVSIDS